MSETSLPWLKHYPEGFPAEINPDRFASIPALFDTVAETYGDKPAFICMDKVLTYREICDLSKDFAGYLQSLPDMKPGDRVAIMMPNLQQYIISLLGILRAGMIAVNVNPLYTSHLVISLPTAVPKPSSSLKTSPRRCKTRSRKRPSSTS